MAISLIESGTEPTTGLSRLDIGPMHFMLAMWVAYGVDGNRDGFADPFDPAAIHRAARLLCADVAGNPKTLIDAVDLYSPGDPTYAVVVMEVAKGYTEGAPAGSHQARGPARSAFTVTRGKLLVARASLTCVGASSAAIPD